MELARSVEASMTIGMLAVPVMVNPNRFVRTPKVGPPVVPADSITPLEDHQKSNPTP